MPECDFQGRAGNVRARCRHPVIDSWVPLARCETCTLKHQTAFVPVITKGTCDNLSGTVSEVPVQLCCGNIATVTVHGCSLHGTCVESQADSSRLTISPRPKVCQLCRDRRPPCYDQLAILTPHFNPCGYTRLKETWWEWFETLGPLRDRLTTIELVYGWQDGPETEADIVLHGDERNFLWQKEALLNIGLRSLPPEIKYVAWIDHDAVFENPHWAEHACQLIDNHSDVVQLWDRVEFTGPGGEVIDSNPGSASRWVQTNQKSGSPGLAWMASRDYLDRIGGLYAHNVVGGGDQFAFDAWTADSWFLDTLTPGERDACRDWIATAREDFRGTLYVPGAVRHLWHGSRQNRQYASRIEILKRHQFDPATDVTINADGLIEWTGANPRLKSAVADYFSARREDS